MTTTYDPFHPKYFDEADLREELTRVYDLCHGCRLCFKFCTSFPTLFDFIDDHDDQDAARMTPGQQDQVVDECFQCKLCYINCPYIPGQSEWELDFPRLMMRAEQVRCRNGESDPQGQGPRPGPRAHRPARQAVQRRRRPVGQHGHRDAGLVTRKADGEDRRHRLRSASCRPSRRTRFSTWFKKRRSTEPRAVDGAAGHGRALPHLPRRVPGPRHRQGPGDGLRAQRHRVHAARGPGLLRRPVAAPGRRRHVRRAGPQERRGPRRRRARPETTSSCPSRPAATCSRTTTSTTSAVPTPSWWPSTPTTPPST